MTTNIERAAEVLTRWADSEGGLAAIARDYDGDLTGAAEALADDGQLMPDLPGPIGEIAAQRYGGNPDSRWIGYYDESGEYTTAGLIDAYPGEVWTPEGVRLIPESARQYAHALLSAAAYAEEHTDDQ